MTTTSRPPEPRPTARQLAYLKALAQRTGQSFTWPTSRAAASSEIARLKAVARISQAERQIERHEWAGETAAREENCDVPIRADELSGYGAQCTWSQRS
jgi:hypothetical protein